MKETLSVKRERDIPYVTVIHWCSWSVFCPHCTAREKWAKYAPTLRFHTFFAWWSHRVCRSTCSL